MRGQLDLFSKGDYLAKGYVRGEDRTFQILRGPEDRPTEWLIHYDDGRHVRVAVADRSGYVHKVSCDADGVHDQPLYISPHGSLGDSKDFPTPQKG